MHAFFLRYIYKTCIALFVVNTLKKGGVIKLVCTQRVSGTHRRGERLFLLRVEIPPKVMLPMAGGVGCSNDIFGKYFSNRIYYRLVHSTHRAAE